MQYTPALRWSLIIGLCGLFLIPFIIADGIHLFPTSLFFPYITGKNIAFRILVEILFGLYIILAIRDPRYRPRSSSLMWALGLFTVWMLVATIFSVDPVKSFWSNFERMEGYITVLHMFALFVVAGAVLTAEKWWERFFKVSVAVSVYQALYAVAQVFGIFGLEPSSQSGARADTTFGNATYLGVYMLINMFVTLFLLVRARKGSVMQGLYALALIFQGTALYYTQTRGAILGLIGGLVIAALYVALFARDPEWRVMRKTALGGLGLIVVLMIVFLSVRNTAFIKESETLSRFASISLTDQPRYLIWNAALQGIKEKPVTGWGQENFNYLFNKYYDPAMYNQEAWFDRAHNEFIDWAVAGGVPAFLLYASLFVLAVWAIYRSSLTVPEQALMLGLLAGYAFNNLFVFDNLVSYAYFMLILAFLHSLSRKELPGWMFMSKPLDDRAVAVAAPIVLVLTVWGVWYLNAPALARANGLIDALTNVNMQTGAQKTPEDYLAVFKRLTDTSGLGYQETVEQLFQFSSNQIAPSTVSPQVKQAAFELTSQRGDELLKERPGDARLELFYGVFLDQFGKYSEALTHLNKALEESPKKQQILSQIGITHIAAGNTKAALPPLKQSFEEEPANGPARVLYAIGLYYDGQQAAGDKLLIDGFGTTAVDDQRLLQVYFGQKRYDRVAAIYALKVKKNPKDAQSMIGHAVTNYFVTHGKAAALAELDQAAKTDANLAEQANGFADQLNKGTLTP